MGALFEKAWVALLGIVGGAMVRGLSDRMREARELRMNVERLAIGVEAVPAQIGALQAEIHRVGARAEAQMESLTANLHSHLERQDARFNRLEDTIEATARRIDQLHDDDCPWLRRPRASGNDQGSTGQERES